MREDHSTCGSLLPPSSHLSPFHLVPQFILDSLITSSKGKLTNILITQPRRVSALGVFSRVSAERVNDGSVGYAIRGESKWDSKTKLLFVTTGVALRRLALEGEGRMLDGVSHVIVDEVSPLFALTWTQGDHRCG